MEPNQGGYLDIWIDVAKNEPIKVSLPNYDITANEIVQGLVDKNFLMENKKYHMLYMLNHDDNIFNVVRNNGDLFVILEEQGYGKGLTMRIDNKKVFIVHGHELGLKDTVARMLENAKAKPVILIEEPSRGMTIIEKFEKHSDVGYAVILMTGDDRGGTKSTSFDDQKIRARQNVIFELGYFLSKLGRHRVFVIYEKGVEIPSDYGGVIYIELDKSEGWKYKLAKELKAGGLDIDLSNL